MTTAIDPCRTNRAAALVVVRHAATRADARRVLEMLGIVAADGHELLPDDVTSTSILDMSGHAPVKTQDSRAAQRHYIGEASIQDRSAVPAGLRNYDPTAFETPTKKGTPKPSAGPATQAPAAAPPVGTAPARSRTGHNGKAAPGARPQVSPSHSHQGTGGGLGAPDAPAGPPTTHARRRNAAQCGTHGGYKSHLRRGEKACEACLAAMRAYANGRSAARSIAAGRTPGRRRPAVCGTASGYSAHRRRGEEACRPCKDALAAAQRERVGRRADAGSAR